MTTYFYSASTGGFYTPDINPTMPTDVVEITEEYYQSLLAGQSEGKVIAAGAKKNPILIDPIIIPPTYSELRAAAYPDYRLYLDGIVKGDQAQIQSYIDACLATKSKHPKGE